MSVGVLAEGRRSFWKPVAVAAGAAVLVAALGATVTDIGPWYRALEKPALQPPDAAFGPAWTLIFALWALSAALAWRDAPGARARQSLLGLFALNGFLNVLWSLLFFRLQRPDWALTEVGPFWLSIVLLIVVAGYCNRLAGWLLLPYLAWVAFAAWLNYEIVRLNAPF